MVGALTGRSHSINDRARDLLLLDSLPGVGPARVRKLVRAFGGAAAAVAAPHTAFSAIAGEAAARSRTDALLLEQVERGLARAADMGMTVLTWSSSRYPGDFVHLADPPPVLFLLGRVELLERSAAVTIVGSRRVTARGREVARALGRALGRRGVVVVSGLALGTDGAAHRGALDVAGDSLAVLGTGADVPYPRTHARLFRALSERGLLVSEFMPGTEATRYNFPRRNRLLAALGSTAVVVVEAGPQSGSLITVDHALDLGRDVWAVPGPIDGPACAGSNALLADGARPLLSIDDFIRDTLGPCETEECLPGVRNDAFDDSELSLLRHLEHGPLAPSELVDRTGRSLPDVLASLTALEVHGQVVRLPGLRYRTAA